MQFTPRFLFTAVFFSIVFLCLPLSAFAQSIRQIDFRNFNYEACFDAPKGAKTIRVKNGKYEGKADDEKVYFEVSSVTYGDLDADGVEEAIVETICSGGGTGRFSDGIVFRYQNGKPVASAHFGMGDRADGGIHEIKFVKGLLKVGRYGGNHGACCPEYIEIHTLKLTGNKLIEVGKPVKTDYENKYDGSATRRVKFARGANSTILKGVAKTNETYLIGAAAGQTMTIRIISQSPRASISLYDEEKGIDQAVNKKLTLKLPTTKDYRLSIIATEGKVNFEIEVTIQ